MLQNHRNVFGLTLLYRPFFKCCWLVERLWIISEFQDQSFTLESQASSPEQTFEVLPASLFVERNLESSFNKL